MTDNIYYLKDSKKFWETHKKAREVRDKKLAKLSLAEKATIAERLQADYEVLQNAKDESKQFGLGELPLDACNVLTTSSSFTKQDFESDLIKASRRIKEAKPSPKSS